MNYSINPKKYKVKMHKQASKLQYTTTHCFLQKYIKLTNSKIHTVSYKKTEIISKIQNITSKFKKNYYDHKSSMSWKLSCSLSFTGNLGGGLIGCPNVPKSIPSTSLLSSTSTNSTHKFEQNKMKNHYNVYTSLQKIKEKSL